MSGPGGLGFTPPESRPTDMVGAVTGQPSEEKREVQLAREILRSCVPIEAGLPASGAAVERIKSAAHELLSIHGA